MFERFTEKAINVVTESQTYAKLYGYSEVTPELLIETGVVKNAKAGIKVLGNGSLEKKLTVKAHKFSASAAEAIDAKGGAHEVI